MKKIITRVTTKLSPILKTDVAYLASGSFWLSLGQMSSVTSSFLLTIAFANFVSVDTYGTYKFVIATAALISIPTLAGINTSLIRAIAQKFEGNIKESIKLKMQWGSLSFFIGIGLALFYNVQGNEFLSQSFFIVAIFVPLMECGSIYSSVLLGKKEFKRNSKFEIFLYLAVSLIQILILFLTDNLIIIILSYFALWTIGRLLILAIVLRNTEIKNNNISRESLSLGKHLSIMKIFSTISSNVDRILLFNLLGPVSVAIYSIALAPVMQLKSASSIIKTLGLPKFSESSQLTKASYLYKVSLLTGVLIAICLGYILLTPFFYTIIFPQYLDAIIYSQILSVAIISFGSILNGTILIAKNAKKILYIQTVVTHTTQVILVVAGILYFDLMGAVIAFVLSQIFYFILSTANVLTVLRK